MQEKEKQNSADERKLTDDDVEAITEALRKKMVNQFFRDLGQGVWGLAWRAILTGILIVAAYGAMKNIH